MGCGGSGGATLSYLMDQLRSDLLQHGVRALPRGWQFVHIDVPAISDHAPDGLGTVDEQGGTYFGCGPKGTAYDVLDAAVTNQIADAARLDAIGTWAPRAPEQVTTPISQGAGQYRAIGRMITLSRVSRVRQLLQTTWDRLQEPATASGMRAVAAAVPGLGSYDSNTPIVLVVSSMAGGAGASMALDVCRLLTLVDGVNPNLMGVFMVTPNIFDERPLPARLGVRPNALAMFGEIVASQTGAARAHDVEVLQALGQPGGIGVPIPFARVFPVGRFAGVNRTPFGDGSANAVYRGLGRGLAGLMMSEKALTPFVAYDLTNTQNLSGESRSFGWGGDWQTLPWGTYGFAGLSMGRDRYAEYSAQRIARGCVDVLRAGHLQPGNRASSSEQVTSLLDSQWATLCRRAGLPVTEADLAPWMTAYAFPETVVGAEARAIVADDLEPSMPVAHGVPAEHWVPAVTQRLHSRSAVLAAAAESVAVRLAFDWHQRLLASVEQEVGGAIAALGLPYGIAVIERLALHVRELLGPAAERLAALQRPELSDVPATVKSTFARLRGTIRNGSQLTDELFEGYRDQLRRHLYGRISAYVGQVLQQFAADVLAPMSRALGEALEEIEVAVATPPTDVGLARLATDQPSAWPSDLDQRVPERFDHAENEVLLTSSAQFDGRYRLDLPRAVDTGGRTTFEDARRPVASAVVSGTWTVNGSLRQHEVLLERLTLWRTRVFPVDPHTQEPVVPSLATYRVHVRPAELLARARQFVARRGESFATFTSLSIADFVRADGESPAERKARHHMVVDRFAEALTLAQPLISVNNTMLRKIYPHTEVEYRYKFSTVPFAGLPDLAADLAAVLQSDQNIDGTSLQNFEGALAATAGVTRIDVFGSYPNYSPLVFDAVLPPAAEQWGASDEPAREEFWLHRRARPLEAALPMTEVERRTMVAGWLLGLVVGQIRIPPPPHTDPVRVWDPADRRWVPFPHPLLTPPDNFIADYDWLPAVLESVLIALARSHEPPVLSSMRPYELLRAVYDDSAHGPASGLSTHSRSGRARAVEWLAGSGSGAQSAVPGADQATDPEERLRQAVGWLTDIRTLAGKHYMQPGRDDAPGGGTFSVVRSRAVASATPAFRDVAADVFWATGVLILMLEGALDDALLRAKQAATPAAPDSRPIPAQEPERIVIPKGGTF